MKKILLICLALAASLSLRAANPLMGVKRIRWWDADYLTVTWNGGITPDGTDKSARDIRKYIVSLVPNPSAADKQVFYNPTDVKVPVGARIIAIDGMDAKGWTPSRFYSVLATEMPHVIRIAVGNDKEYDVNFGSDLPVWITASGFHPLTCKWQATSYNKMSERFKIRMDKEVNWSKFSSYDYYYSSDDVLADKELFEKICSRLESHGLVRNQDDPDVVFTIVKDANKSVEYNYVPETVEHVQTGSVSTPVYGWKGKYLGSVTNNKYQTVKSGGYTQKTATTTAYLEVDMLEARRLGEKTLPLIWQLKYNYTENVEADVDKLYSTAVSWVDWPIMDEKEEKISTSCSRYFYGDIPLYDFGIILDADSVVVGLDGASDVVKKSGLKLGDRLTGIQVTMSRSLDKYRRKRYSGSLSVLRDGAPLSLPFSGCSQTRFFPAIQYAASYATVN